LFAFFVVILAFQGEICLEKYLPISGKLSITNYLK